MKISIAPFFIYKTSLWPAKIHPSLGPEIINYIRIMGEGEKITLSFYKDKYSFEEDHTKILIRKKNTSLAISEECWSDSFQIEDAGYIIAVVKDLNSVISKYHSLFNIRNFNEPEVIPDNCPCCLIRVTKLKDKNVAFWE